jgi:hypothetical protein
VSAGQPITLTVSVDAYPPPSYQWFFNQVAIPNAIYRSIQIPSAGPEHAGSYYAVLGHMLGNFTTRTAIVTVRVPLTITSQPQSQTAVLGSSTLFRVGANGDAPLSYQWFFNGTTALGTGASLRLSPLRTQDAGAYTAVVRNGSGAVTSAPAILNVIPPVDLVPAPAVFGQADPGSFLHLEYTDTLTSDLNWAPLGEVAVTTNTSLVYIDWPSSPTPRYYRAWQTNGVTTPPFLSMEPVSAITLRGSAGSFVRVDCINQFGPIDAWVTLATVRLNNPSDFYFDLSARGQPARLYRLVPLP